MAVSSIAERVRARLQGVRRRVSQDVRRRRYELGRRLGPRRVYGLHHQDNRNIGDRECRPLSYFAHLAGRGVSLEEMSLTSPDVRLLRDEIVVLGGGGLLNPWCWNTVIRPLHERGNTLVAWGIGHHHDTVPAHQYGPEPVTDWRQSIATYETDYPLDIFALCGIRDRTPFTKWVPCCSCMSPAFDRVVGPGRPAVIYEHGILDPIAITGPPRMTNVGAAPLDEVLDFLGSGEVVITNSYHGAYWATLLGRRVLVYEPWNSKFALLYFPLTTCTRRNWLQKLDEAVGYPRALERCRERNRTFAREVFDAIHARLGVQAPQAAV